ncbi:response regulator [Flavisolibacter sp. BT320]|nr:response regulator [Flavisolibacter longurius]
MEDDIDDQELLEDAMRAIDPLVTMVSFMYGRKFIEALEKTSPENLPQLIILDYNIPEMNGLDLLLYLKENSRYQAITKVVWSTSSSNQFRTDCLALGATDYIVKPSSFAEMSVLAQTFLSFCRNGKD